VLVDLNHPLAGERLLYEVKVDRLIEGDKEKVEALARSYNIEPKSVELSNGVAKVVIGNDVKKDSDYFVNKTLFVRSVLDYISSINKVVIEEEYEREAKEEKDQKILQ